MWYLRYGSSAQIATVGKGIQNDDSMYVSVLLTIAQSIKNASWSMQWLGAILILQPQVLKKYYCASSWRNNKFVPWFVRSIRYVNFTRLFVTFVTSIKFHRPRGTLIRPIRLELSSQVSDQMCVHSAALYDKVLGQHYGHVFVKYLLFMFFCKMNCKAYFYSW